jgi:hypothetical protein
LPFQEVVVVVHRREGRCRKPSEVCNTSGTKENELMATDMVIEQIESRTKIEALIGLSITTLIGLMSQKIYLGLPIPIEIFWALGLLGTFYFILELLSYLRFYIQKMVFLKQQELLSKIKILEIEVECRKLEHQITLAQLATVEA